MKTKESKLLKNNELFIENSAFEKSIEINGGTIRLSEIKVSTGIKSVTKKAKDLQGSLKGCLVMYRELITPILAVKGDKKVAAYNKTVRNERAMLGPDITAFLLNTRVAVRYVAMVLPNVDGIFMNEYTVYSESINMKGEKVVYDVRNNAVKLGTPIVCNNGNTTLRNTIEEPTIDNNGLKRIKGWLPVKKYTLDYVQKFIGYAIELWIADNRPSR